MAENCLRSSSLGLLITGSSCEFTIVSGLFIQVSTLVLFCPICRTPHTSAAPFTHEIPSPIHLKCTLIPALTGNHFESRSGAIMLYIQSPFIKAAMGTRTAHLCLGQLVSFAVHAKCRNTMCYLRATSARLKYPLQGVRGWFISSTPSFLASSIRIRGRVTGCTHHSLD